MLVFFLTCYSYFIENKTDDGVPIFFNFRKHYPEKRYPCFFRPYVEGILDKQDDLELGSFEKNVAAKIKSKQFIKEVIFFNTYLPQLTG